MRKTFLLFPLVASAFVRHLHVDRYFSRSLVMRIAPGQGVDGKSKKGGLAGGVVLPPPRSDNQKLYVDYLNDPLASMIFSVGPAGTGKTLFACSAAVQELKRGSIQKIVLTRPVVSVDEDLGFLPGSLDDKMAPWTRPMFDILGEFFSKKEVDSMIDTGKIEISPLAYMRGRTFKNAFIVADEMQNSSPTQMFMLTTRLGEGSRMVITGDLGQSDRAVLNGLSDILSKLKSYRGDWSTIRLIELGVQDVERSATVSKILDIYGGGGGDVGGGGGVKRSPDTQPRNDDCALIINDPLTRGAISRKN